jgi:hypothetical protein
MYSTPPHITMMTARPAAPATPNLYKIFRYEERSVCVVSIVGGTPGRATRGVYGPSAADANVAPDRRIKEKYKVFKNLFITAEIL